MKKVFFLVLMLSLLVFPLVSSINIEVEKLSSGEVLIKELGKPVTLNVSIKNNGNSDIFKFYNFEGFSMSPESVSISGGETKNIEIILTPLKEFNSEFRTIKYFIRASSDNSDFEQRFVLKIAELSNAFHLQTSKIDPESTRTTLTIKNLENFNFEKIDAEFSSPFFAFDESFSLGPGQTKTIDVELDDENSGLVAGFYTLTADIETQGIHATVEGTIEFVEKNIVTTTNKDFGFFINTQVIEKKNEGNLVEQSETLIKKNIISRLFTSFTPEPDLVDRRGTGVYYTWTRPVSPGETFVITAKTNWFFPLLIIVFIVAIVILAKQYSRTDLFLRKKVTFVKAKGGEFALKVSVHVNAKRHIERVNIIDRLPALVKIYERFGGEKPTKIDEKNRRLEWSFENLEPGEIRVLSYIIYSKVGVMGKFALPSATAIYERNGTIHETESNQAFFVSEQRTKDLEE